ncbi:TonB-dependent receptor [Microbulbifer agarilyticus]|uniref:TonB-dependent receptor n=1 Tax=Microbulbifer agarilyticus TaxID=260552 RepID=UPI001C9874F1|nr:TonB-dependent receptor [Microbulbifer agarilyticus]MBY6191706.1 TonB-dependent receptor [Microbulbifer agarilyticus]
MTTSPPTASTFTSSTLLALSLAVATGSAHSTAEEQATGLEQVSVTAARTPQPLLSQPASVSIVNGETLSAIGAVHPSQALSSVPGMNINRGNGQESLIGLRSPVLTGAGSCGAFAVAQDGIPVRGAGFCNVNQLFDTHFEQAGRVEVLRGPGTVLYGSDAQHGVINVLSSAPVQGSESTIGIEGGANDYQRLQLTHNRGDDQGGTRIDFTGARDGGYKDDSGFDQQKLQLRNDRQWQDWSISALLNLSNLNQETAGYVVGKDAYKDNARKRENPNPEAFRDSQAARAQVKIQRTLGNGDELQITPYARYTDMAFLMHFLPGTPLEENGQKGVGVQTSLRQQIDPALTLTSGVDLEYTAGWLKQTQDGGFSVFPAGNHYDYSVSAAVAAIFAQADWQLDERTTGSIGARGEYLRYDYDNHMIGGDTQDNGDICISGFTGAIGCRYSRPDDRADDFANLSLNASLTRQLGDQLSGVLRLASGFRAPQATELYRLQNGQTRADLDSESIDSLEAGIRHAGETLRYSLTGFYMEKSDVVFQSSDRLNLSDGESRHYGLEYELDWRLSEAWKLAASGTFARHQYTSDLSAPGSGPIASDGNDIDTAPRAMHSLNLAWQPADATEIALQWQYTGGYFTDIGNAHRYDGHQLLHLRARQALSDSTSVGLRIENLADVDYAERADYSSLGGGDRYFIGEPRSVYADVKFRF